MPIHFSPVIAARQLSLPGFSSFLSFAGALCQPTRGTYKPLTRVASSPMASTAAVTC